jgi:hypothetical protein
VRKETLDNIRAVLADRPEVLAAFGCQDAREFCKRLLWVFAYPDLGSYDVVLAPGEEGGRAAAGNTFEGEAFSFASCKAALRFLLMPEPGRDVPDPQCNKCRRCLRLKGEGR